MVVQAVDSARPSELVCGSRNPADVVLPERVPWSAVGEGIFLICAMRLGVPAAPKASPYSHEPLGHI